jgi:hypothetical protein
VTCRHERSAQRGWRYRATGVRQHTDLQRRKLLSVARVVPARREWGALPAVDVYSRVGANTASSGWGEAPLVVHSPQ